MAAWVLTAGLALAGTAGCNWLNLRGRDEHRQPAPHEVERIQQISERAQAAIDRGDYENARADLVQLVDEEPDSPEALQRLGTVLMLEGRYAEAEACFHASLARDHDYVEAMLGLGQVEAQRSDTATALKRFEMAISIDPRRPRAHYLLGRAREAVGQTDEALAAYFRALEFNANDAQSIVRIAAIQLARSQPDQALSRLDQAIELAPGDGDARALRGLAHWKLHHIPEAIVDLSAATQRLPNRPDVYYNLALVLEADHKRADARSAAETALRLAPTDSAVRELSERLRR
jgi:tetratricopeptide (TPR) repeat protein